MCEHAPPRSLAVAFEPAAVAGARALLDRCACPVHGIDRLAEARLVVSELVTNAITHGAPPVLLTVECRAAGGTLISVTDTGPGDVRLVAADRLAEGGRGVMLVDVVSRAWGTRQTGDSKQVWALV